ncbi:MAG: 3-oxoacyl-ACP reductase FabG [Candidatus Schekmanbacteria bacterium]|nr:3-oxoacyl-ACP reductase FabG [Candidatus Schekmanbacteria bacterium]
MAASIVDLRDSAAVVTGGTRGIGRAIAERLALAGARVTAVFRSETRAATELSEWAAAAGLQVRVEQADVSRSEDVEAVFDRHLAAYGTCDILVNNAAVLKDALAPMMKLEDWDRLLAVNLTGPFLCSRRAIRAMIRQRRGRIVNVISPSALSGRIGQAAYSASKGGLLSLTKTLAIEVGRFGILVNAIAPGVVRTEMLKDVPEDVLAKLRSNVPMERFGQPGEIADAVLFLVGPDSGYITGQLLCIDGGISLMGAAETR